MKQAVFSACDRQFGPMLVMTGFTGFAAIFEWVWMTYAFNHPLNPCRGQYNLTDLGKVASHPRSQEIMAPLLDEWLMRYPGLFEQPLWIRTLHGFSQVCKEVSDMNKGRPSTASQAPAGYDDL